MRRRTKPMSREEKIAARKKWQMRRKTEAAKNRKKFSARLRNLLSKKADPDLLGDRKTTVTAAGIMISALIASILVLIQCVFYAVVFFTFRFGFSDNAFLLSSDGKSLVIKDQDIKDYLNFRTIDGKIVFSRDDLLSFDETVFGLDDLYSLYEGIGEKQGMRLSSIYKERKEYATWLSDGITIKKRLGAYIVETIVNEGILFKKGELTFDVTSGSDGSMIISTESGSDTPFYTREDYCKASLYQVITRFYYFLLLVSVIILGYGLFVCDSVFSPNVLETAVPLIVVLAAPLLITALKVGSMLLVLSSFGAICLVLYFTIKAIEMQSEIDDIV